MNDDTPPGGSAPPTPSYPAYTYGRRTRDIGHQLRTGTIWVLFAFGVLSLIIAYQSLLSVLNIWFEYRFEAIARGIMTLLLAAGAATGIVFLLKANARH